MKQGMKIEKFVFYLDARHKRQDARHEMQDERRKI